MRVVSLRGVFLLSQSSFSAGRRAMYERLWSHRSTSSRPDSSPKHPPLLTGEGHPESFASLRAVFGVPCAQ